MQVKEQKTGEKIGTEQNEAMQNKNKNKSKHKLPQLVVCQRVKLHTSSRGVVVGAEAAKAGRQIGRAHV